jgi:hypothetical protein
MAVTIDTPAPATEGISDRLFKEALLTYGTNPLFADSEEWTFPESPYHRPIRPKPLRYLDFDKPMSRGQVFDYTSLAANRILLNLYETDMVFLPEEPAAGWLDDFKRFYQTDDAVVREIVRVRLEKYLFSFLDDEIETTGSWTAKELEAWLIAEVETAAKQPSAVFEAIRQSRNPEHAMRTMMIQFAGDFLSEASAMARNVLGSYGPAQSEIFKILIDEYGYGVHETKHSTLFQDLLRSIDLAPTPHTYWQFYLTSSLMLNNYFHHLGKNHANLFKYIGALYYTEATLPVLCRDASKALKDVFGDGAATRYFDEHVLIDQHHGRMALDKVVLPIVAKYGPSVIPDIVRGVAEYKLLASIADQDFLAQVAWSDGEHDYKALHDPIHRNLMAGRIQPVPPTQRIVEPRGELSVTHVHDGDELCHIVSGTMRFVTGHERNMILEAGEGTVIRANRLHGAIIESEECVYEITSIGDHRKCLS